MINSFITVSKKRSILFDFKLLLRIIPRKLQHLKTVESNSINLFWVVDSYQGEVPSKRYFKKNCKGKKKELFSRIYMLTCG